MGMDLVEKDMGWKEYWKGRGINVRWASIILVLLTTLEFGDALGDV